MALENLVGTDKYVLNLVNTNPTGGDDKREGDDHLRGIKNVLLNSFPTINAAITMTPAQLNSIPTKVAKAGDAMTGPLTGSNGDVFNQTDGAVLKGRRWGYIFADQVSSGTTGNYTVTVTGFNNQGAAGGVALARFYFVTFLSYGTNHQVKGVALYGQNWDGGALLLAMLGKNEIGGTMAFGSSGQSPTIAVTNTGGSIASYSCQVVTLN